MSSAPVLALVGATGLVGGHLLPTFLVALSKGQLSAIRILTSSPDSDKLNSLRSFPKVSIHAISYSDSSSVEQALSGVGILISAMGSSPTKEGSYESSKATLLKAAAAAKVKVYTPSEWGTDHASSAAQKIGSPMFTNKQEHHAEAERLGIKVVAIYNALLLEMSFSAWLGLDISIPNPIWTIPTPSYPVAFTSFQDIGPYVLSATLQAYRSVDIPSRLRVYSDSLTLDEAADLWEKETGNKIERKSSDGEELQKRYEEIKPTLQPGMLGPAIPWMMSQGGFDHSKDNSNALLNRGEFAFETHSVADFFASLSK
ncbi:NmrA-like family-domain-containing protein [Leucosporidium creatinivorum]|uniref:NmrA-like family-domain-containing protein n=1 Tax=Leucosporidium creatinivorum TaxID=106004 RepID=A0A1Y2CLH0_9BASI|nr:NmrA-like family-domain-containing protein [Leucosporidium creatinivorum]